LMRSGQLPTQWRDELCKVEGMPERFQKWDKLQPVDTKLRPPENSADEHRLEELKLLADKLDAEAKQLQETLEQLLKLGKQSHTRVDNSIAESLAEAATTGCNSAHQLSSLYLTGGGSISTRNADGPDRKRARLEEDANLLPTWVQQQTLADLSRITFSRQQRYNVSRTRDRASLPFGCIFGLRWDYRGKCGISRTSLQNAQSKGMFEFLCDLVRTFKPDFKFTSIQVNKSVTCVLHVDKRNCGESLIIALGDFAKGELYVHGLGKVCVRNTWYKFDGNCPHLTCPFDGERYCIVYFSTAGFEAASSKDKQTLRSLGVNLPADGSVKTTSSSATTLEEARAALPPELSDCVTAHSASDEDDEEEAEEPEEDEVSKETRGEDDVEEDEAILIEDENFAKALRAHKENGTGDKELEKILQLSLQDFEETRAKDTEEQANVEAALKRSREEAEVAAKRKAEEEEKLKQEQQAINNLREVTGCSQERAMQALRNAKGDQEAAANDILEHP